MMITEQLNQSRIKFRESSTTQEIDVQYGEGESATTVTVTVSALSRKSPVSGTSTHYLKIVMPFRRVIETVLMKHPDITLRQSNAIERYVLEKVREFVRHGWWFCIGWWFRAGEFFLKFEPYRSCEEVLHVSPDMPVHGRNTNLRQFTRVYVSSLLDYVDGLVNEWLANNKE